ncbi:MAG: DMT family transporter [Cypionkella sp.]|nr:DMT family transporter [Cypionkella sp.]
MNRNFMIAAGLAALASLCWAGNWVLGRAIRADVPPFGLTFWRWALASVILLPFAHARLVADWRILRAHAPLILGMALLSASMFQSMTYIGLHSTEAVNALLVSATMPLFMVIIAGVVLRERFSPRQLAGIGISFLGVAYIIARGEVGRLLALHLNVGDLWILAALVVWGLYSVLLKFKPAQLSPVGLTFFIAIFGAVFILPLHVWEMARGQFVPLTWAGVGSVAYTGVFASVIALLAYNAAVARIGPSRAVFFLHLMPVFGAGLAVLFLGETLASYHLIGFPVALAGVIWATTAPARS